MNFLLNFKLEYMPLKSKGTAQSNGSLSAVCKHPDIKQFSSSLKE